MASASLRRLVYAGGPRLVWFTVCGSTRTPNVKGAGQASLYTVLRCV